MNPAPVHNTAIRHRVANDRVKAGHPEAIAVRRLVIARGAWLSPLYATLPLPELTPWEASCDLVSALNTWLAHEQRKTRDRETRTRNGGGRNRSQETPTLREVQAIRRHGKQGANGRFTKVEPLALPTVALAPAPAPLAPVEAKKWVSLKEATPRHSTRKTPPPRHAPTQEEKLLAVARIAAIAAEKEAAAARIAAIAAEKEAKARELEAKKAEAKAASAARRKETAKAAGATYAQRLAERVAKDAAYAKAYRAKRRAQEHARNAEQRAATAARKAANNTPEAISARKAKEYERRKVRDRERMANDPAFAAKVKAKKAAIERKRLERNRAAKEEAAKAKLREVAEGIAAEARAKRAERGLQRLFEKAQREARKASSGGDK